jgi:mannose-6-phosphate isomerase-like protein (cupin superfamily)
MAGAQSEKSKAQPLAEAICRDNAEHYSWGEHCQGWNLVRNAGLSVIEEIMPPGTVEQIHRHHVAQQFFYVLSGEAVMEFGDQKVAMGPGQGVTINPDVAHRIRNLSNTEVRFLVISQPSTKNGDRENLSRWPELQKAAQGRGVKSTTGFKTETK